MAKPFGFLGFDFDTISRAAEKSSVDTFAESHATWDQAISAASQFSEGRACTRGIGSKTEDSNKLEGSFNICFWIKVEGKDTQWVVRFPKPIAPESVIRTKLRSEVATLKYLKEHTKVPVPTLIGYDLGTDDSTPPFLIIENVDGIKLSFLWAIDLPERILNSVLKSLAGIQHELLSHPFHEIGMLDLSSNEHRLIGPASLDALEHCRDQVAPIPTRPLESASKYYEYKLEVARNRLHQQRNSIRSRSDGRRKFLNLRILKEYTEKMSKTGNPGHESSFFLVHPDLHGLNVIIDDETWTVKAIIDWEGACILPRASALTPPRCLSDISLHECLPDSTEWEKFQARSKRYSDKFSAVAYPGFTLYDPADPTVFFIWAMDDTRYTDELIWQQLAPRTYPDLQQEYNRICENSAICNQHSHEFVVAKFVEDWYSREQESSCISGAIKQKLEDLETYEDELKRTASGSFPHQENR